MDLPQSTNKTEAVAWFIVSDQTPSSSCSRGIDSHTCKLELGLVRNENTVSSLLGYLSFFQALSDSHPLLRDSESCLALISEAQSRQHQYSGLLTDARPATTQSYIYIHKTEENGEIRHTFCYCLETDRWKELGTGSREGPALIPDPPGSCLTSYAEKVHIENES